MVAGAALSAACDAGSFRADPATQPTAKIRLLGANVGPNQTLPANGAVQLAFDRYLLPSTQIRQSIQLVTVAGEPVEPPVVQYDPVARTVTLSSMAGTKWLAEGQTYRVVAGIPENKDANGFRALDGATLETPISITFLVGPPRTVELDPPVDFCVDVLPIFSAKCSGSACHSSGDVSRPSVAAASLVLDSSIGVQGTAINRVSQAANTGARFNESAAGKVFGVNMPLIAPNNPGNSWLLYKILLAPPPASVPAHSPYTCAKAPPSATPAAPYTPLAPYSEVPSPNEQAVLQDNVLGREMPFPVAQPTAYESLPLTFAERQIVRAWISRGAPTPDCGGCAPVAAPARDAGSTDSGSGDSGSADAGSD